MIVLKLIVQFVRFPGIRIVEEQVRHKRPAVDNLASSKNDFAVMIERVAIPSVVHYVGYGQYYLALRRFGHKTGHRMRRGRGHWSRRGGGLRRKRRPVIDSQLWQQKRQHDKHYQRGNGQNAHYYAYEREYRPRV